MEETEYEDDGHTHLSQSLKHAILAPFHIATSPTLLRTYLKTILFLIASGILFAFAVVAYTSFYYAYVPIRGLSAPVYLQYDHTAVQIPRLGSMGIRDESRKLQTRHPYGIANLQGLVSKQKYDIIVDMHVPRSERNLAAGNWMLSLELRSPEIGSRGMKSMLGWDEEWEVDDYSQGGVSGTSTDKVQQQASDDLGSKIKAAVKPVVLARSRRPAILTYRSWITELAFRFLRLPLYVLGFGQEAEHVKIKMMEGVVFGKGWRNVPTSLRLEVRSNPPLEVYSIAVRVVARLEGLRWIMDTYRLSSAVVFISIFWGVEVGVVLLTWGAFSLFFAKLDQYEDGTSSDANSITNKTSSPSSSEKKRTNREDNDFAAGITPKTEPADESAPPTPLSDTSRTFPTLSSHQPLHYASSSDVKRERGGSGVPSGFVVEDHHDDDGVKREEEADDEEEEEDDFLLEGPVGRSWADLDSGIGTGLESSMEREREREGRGGVSRRKSGRRGA